MTEQELRIMYCDFTLFLQLPDKTALPDFLQMAADLIPGITSVQLDFSLDSLLPLLIITTLNVILVALLLTTRRSVEKVLQDEYL